MKKLINAIQSAFAMPLSLLDALKNTSGWRILVVATSIGFYTHSYWLAIAIYTGTIWLVTDILNPILKTVANL